MISTFLFFHGQIRLVRCMAKYVVVLREVSDEYTKNRRAER
jgi:hypothetical protein